MSQGESRGQGSDAGGVGASEALTTLIDQFSDPLVFLRELVQNSLDADSTRIDVGFTWQPSREPSRPSRRGGDPRGEPAGLMTIAVSDDGHGMNETIIDDYLLTLFRSNKEDDRTKIGKFGVGFVSVFAIEPELVVLDTRQAGESWRVLFHPDRSYEKLRPDARDDGDAPLDRSTRSSAGSRGDAPDGTRVLIYKRVDAAGFDDLRDRGRQTVHFWCKYAEVPVHVDGEPINQPFGVDAALAVHHDEPGTSIALGFAPVRQPWDPRSAAFAGRDAAAALEPIVGFYNRGLTLVESQLAPESGAGESGYLAGLSLRVKSQHLEHTLTRDNVRQDEHYARALGLVRGQIAKALRPGLIEHLEHLAARVSALRAVEEGEGSVSGSDSGYVSESGPGYGAALLYARLPSMELHRHAPDAAIVAVLQGAPLSLRDLRRARTPDGEALFAAAINPLTRLLAEHEIPVIPDDRDLLAHLQLCGLAVAPASSRFQTAVPVPERPHHRLLLGRVTELLDHARARVSRVALGDLAYPGSVRGDALLLRQQTAFGLTRPGHDDRATLLGGARHLVLNLRHAVVSEAVALACTDPALAAQILAQAICLAEDHDPGYTASLATTAMTWKREARSPGK